jgi:hypothetical protein
VKHDLIYTTDTQLAQATTVFIVDKHITNFISQARICCNDPFITEDMDFASDVNILSATFSD